MEGIEEPVGPSGSDGYRREQEHRRATEHQEELAGTPEPRERLGEAFLATGARGGSGAVRAECAGSSLAAPSWNEDETVVSPGAIAANFLRDRQRGRVGPMLLRLGPWVLALAALACAPSEARAWADASVRSARARVVLSEDAETMHVVLTAELRVAAGWLEGFDLDGLDEGLTLDPDAPVRFERWAIPEPEPIAAPEPIEAPEEAEPLLPRAPVFVELLEPRVTVRDGRIALGFPRRHAPRAGLYRVVATYDAPAAGHVLRSAERAELVWTLPAWRFGLDNVEVVLVLPEGSAPAALAEEDEFAIEVAPAELEEGETGAAFRFTRVHLPRTQSWTMRAELPASFRAAAPAASPPPSSPLLGPEPVSHPAALLFVALLVATLVIGRVRSRDDEARAAGASAGAPLPATARLVLATLGFWIVVALVFVRPDLWPFGLAALALVGAHAPSRPTPLRLGSFRAAWGNHARAARRSSWSADLFDAGAPAGAGLLVALGVAAGSTVAAGWLVAPDAALTVACASVILVAGSGPGRPRPARAILAALFAWAERWRAPEGVALAPLVHVDIQGRAQTARLRLVIDGAPEGLVRCDVVAGDRAPRLVISARAGTEAERRLLAVSAESGWTLVEVSEGRLGATGPLDALAALVRALRDEPASAPRAAA